MQGGPSHVDTYDYKPALYKNDGKKIPFDDARTIARTGKARHFRTRHETNVEVQTIWRLGASDF